MANPLIRVYDTLTTAENARQALLGSGFDAENVHLTSTLEEAGPVEGNGVLDAKDTGDGPKDGGLLSKLFGTEERTDAYNNSEPVWRGNFILTVDAEDDDQRARASDIMERFGATDVEARITGREH